MKNKYVFLIAGVLFALAIIVQIPHAQHFAPSHLFDDALNFVPSADAQVPPIPQARPVTAYATTTGAGAMDMLPAPAGSNVTNYIYQAMCVNTSASTQMVAFIKDGSTTLVPIPCAPAVSPVPVNFNPPLRQPTTGTKLTMTASTATTTAYFYMSGFTAR